MAELLLYAADRAQHLEELIEPALARGAVVLTDRYLDATLAYQGYGRELGSALILKIHSHPPLDRRPVRTVLLDMDAEIGLNRARVRNTFEGTTISEGRFEEEHLAFHTRVRDGYLLLAAQDPERYRVVDANSGIEEVEKQVWDTVRDIVLDVSRWTAFPRWSPPSAPLSARTVPSICSAGSLKPAGSPTPTCSTDRQGSASGRRFWRLPGHCCAPGTVRRNREKPAAGAAPAD
jgi:dTMP kinase